MAAPNRASLNVLQLPRFGVAQAVVPFYLSCDATCSRSGWQTCWRMQPQQLFPMSRLPSEVADSVKNRITLSSNQLTWKDVGVTPVKWEPCINSAANSSCFYADSVWLSWFDVATCSKLRFWLPSRFPSAISFWPPEHPHLSNDSNGIILPMSSMSSLRERTPAPHVPWMDMAALAAPHMEAPWLGKNARTIRTPQVHLSHRLI